MTDVTITNEVPDVTVTEEAVTVTIEDDSPIVTVVDNDSTIITVIDAVPTVTVSASDDTIVNVIADETNVYVNEGLASSYDKTTVLGLLAASITSEMLSSSLNADLNNLNTLWSSLGGGTVLADILAVGDGSSIQTASQEYTNALIASTVISIEVVDDRVDLAFTNIQQTADDIISMAVDISAVEGSVESHATLIQQNADAIISTAAIVDGHTSSISTINQTADNIILSVSSVESDVSDLNAEVLATQASIVLTDASIVIYVSRLNAAENTLTSASSTLSDVLAETVLQRVALDDDRHTLTAIQHMSADHWGVTIAETGAYSYATGFGLTLHPDWESGATYVHTPIKSRAYVYDGETETGTVYSCKLGHTADADNHPLGASGGTYWDEEPAGKKSAFNIQASTFNIYDATNGTQALFAVDGAAVTIGTGIGLKSASWNGTTEPGYYFNASTKIASFVNMDVNFSSGGVLHGGKATYADTTAGWWLGYDTVTAPTGNYKIHIGDATKYIRWTGAALEIAGNVTATTGAIGGWNIDSTTIYTGVKDVSGFTDPTTGGISINSASGGSIHSRNFYIDTSGNAYFKGDLNGASITGTGITLSAAGNIKGGQTEYATGNGFFLGYQDSKYKFSIGNGTTSGIAWDGTTFNVYGDLIATGNIKSSNITTALIADSNITTDLVLDNAITKGGANSGGAITTTYNDWEACTSLTYTSVGEAVLVACSVEVHQTTAAQDHRIRIRLGASTIIAYSSWISVDASAGAVVDTLQCIGVCTPGSGSKTFYADIFDTVNDVWSHVNSSQIMVIEVLK